MKTIKQKGIREIVRAAGYRLSAEAWPELDQAVTILLERAMQIAHPAKTLGAEQIVRARRWPNRT